MNSRFQDYLDACIMVREFYVEERYPFLGSPPPARNELEKALDSVRDMIALILERSGQ